jgi:hypothetical protein
VGRENFSRYNILTVQPGAAMTVKEMEPVSYSPSLTGSFAFVA